LRRCGIEEKFVILVCKSLVEVGRPALDTVLPGKPRGLVSIAASGDRLAALLQGGGEDRIVLIDLRTGTLAGRVKLLEGTPANSP